MAATNGPDCDAVLASIVTPASSATWAEAILSRQGTAVPALVQWADALSAHGCTNPELVSFMNEGALGKVWVTTCPADVGTTVADVENLTWAEMTLTCNQAVPVAPAGFVNYGWFFGTPLIPGHPTAPPVRGCSLGECASAPDSD